MSDHVKARKTIPCRSDVLLTPNLTLFSCTTGIVASSWTPAYRISSYSYTISTNKLQHDIRMYPQIPHSTQFVRWPMRMCRKSHSTIPVSNTACWVTSSPQISVIFAAFSNLRGQKFTSRSATSTGLLWNEVLGNSRSKLYIGIRGGGINLLPCVVWRWYKWGGGI